MKTFSIEKKRKETLEEKKNMKQILKLSSKPSKFRCNFFKNCQVNLFEKLYFTIFFGILQRILISEAITSNHCDSLTVDVELLIRHREAPKSFCYIKFYFIKSEEIFYNIKVYKMCYFQVVLA